MDAAKRFAFALGTVPRDNKVNAHVPPPWHKGDEHNHEPCNNWKAVQDKESYASAYGLLCKASSTPADLVSKAKARFYLGYPLALAHIEWYLSEGGGADFTEDDPLTEALTDDNGIRAAIGSRLPVKTTGREVGYFTLKQEHYGLSKYRLAWGAIDRLDYAADYDAQTLNVWFQDRYEWHPYYPGLYDVQSGDGNPVRSTNCIHAAFVEMKLQGAADFWMKGDAYVSLQGIPGLTLGSNVDPEGEEGS